MAALRTTKREAGILKSFQEIREVKQREPPVTLPGNVGVNANLSTAENPLKSVTLCGMGSIPFKLFFLPAVCAKS